MGHKGCHAKEQFPTEKVTFPTKCKEKRHFHKDWKGKDKIVEDIRRELKRKKVNIQFIGALGIKA